jgi:hypothetical protein
MKIWVALLLLAIAKSELNFIFAALLQKEQFE